MATKESCVYKITINNWSKHNPNLKKTHKKFLFYSGFFSDDKIASLSRVQMILYVYMLCVACEQGSNTIRVHVKQMPKTLRVDDKYMLNTLNAFERNQLVTWEKSSLIELNRIEKNRKEDNRSLVKGKMVAARQPGSAGPVIAAYCDFWKSRYKSDASPPIIPHHAKLIKNLVSSVGVDKALQIVEAYLKMPDHWFVTKRHDIPTLWGNLNAITQFIETGKMFTRNEIKSLDASVTNQKTIDALKSGEV